jgi:TonB family protein
VKGNVGIDVVVETDGHVSEARITRSIPLLDGAAMAAIQGWKFAPLSARTTVETVFEFTFEDLPRSPMRSNLWVEPQPSQDDAVIFNVFCNGGTIEFAGLGMSSIDEMPSNLLAEPNAPRISLNQSEVAAIHDAVRATLSPFAARLFAWRDTPPKMRVNIRGRRVSAVVPASAPSLRICVDACDGAVHGLYLRHAGVWTQLSDFLDGGRTKPFFNDEFAKLNKALRATVRKSEPFQALPPRVRACMNW